MWSIVDQFETRQQGSVPLRHLWRRGQWAIRPSEGPRHQVRRVVLANALALTSFQDPADLHDLAELARQLGVARLTDLQDEVLAAIDPPARRPRTTALVVRVARAAWHEHDGGEEGDRGVYADVVTHLLLHRDDDAAPAPATSRAAVLRALDEGNVPSWRRQASAIAAEPWAGPGSAWIALLDPSRDAFALACLSAHVDRAQRDAAAQERGAVAKHIRRTIAEAGVSQREFAQLIGTSQSRLSTYVSGTVVPSAAMLVRISQAGDGLRRSARSG
ncbi:helix-turn-helix domain-containing protein [Nocardioides carbamazepini]|uniref:helix-turn-helix domain-containing protein n=1 Tax=Nocardioides carbamazepini TaxID=2854259 RepID=UPI002149A1D4|nr:helix-turn-helix transcriptional regulator [Nocardioides carbamazepini]MCR1784585.1 helix-turn-helix domain-containing protein [Nocardioides carbamazepini]